MSETVEKDKSTPAYAIIEIATGRIVSAGVSQRGRECEQIGSPHSPYGDRTKYDYLCLDEPVDPNAYAVVHGVLVKKPEQN